MSSRRRSLRTHLAAAIGLIVVLSVGLTLIVGSVLTRRAAKKSPSSFPSAGAPASRRRRAQSGRDADARSSGTIKARSS